MSSPSMVHRSGDVLVVRSVVSGNPLYEGGQKSTISNNEDESSSREEVDDESDLPQCKIKRNYSCNLCPFFSQNPRSFLYHSRDVHFDKIKIYECPHCLYASKHSQKLQRHINMIHVAGKSNSKAKRQMKKKELPTPVNDIQINEIKEEKDEMVEEEEDKMEIIMVDAIKPEDELEKDDILPEGERKCSVCNYTTKSKTIMRRHERIVHLKKRFFRCSKCSYVTHVKARYTKHVKYHSMPMIKCDLCDFRTPYKWNLDRHYKNHCGKGAFQCSKCNFRADIKQSLTVHEMNHHIPPVGQRSASTWKRNKVGASENSALESDDIDQEELELLRLEREDPDVYSLIKGDAKGATEQSSWSNKSLKPTQANKSETPRRTNEAPRLLHSNRRESSHSSTMQSDFIHPDDIVPRYGQIYVKNLKCKFCSYKAVFNHEIWRHEKRIHGYVRPEHKREKVVPSRPPPNLIPIQNKSSPNKSPILKIPFVKKRAINSETSAISKQSESVMNETEFEELCKKSCLTSSLKDFASLIEDETLTQLTESKDTKIEEGTEQLKYVKETAPKSQNEISKKKNASFFDQLKEKLMTGANEDCNLVCETCGHESKCLSESVAHQKRHASVYHRNESDHFNENDLILSGAELSSTRCQHCRQRCKTSSDLINHLKACKAFGAALDQQNKEDREGSEERMSEEQQKYEEDEEEEDICSEGNSSLGRESHPMENRVFVWNDIPEQDFDEDDLDEELSINEPLTFRNSLPPDTDMEPIPGYGAVTNKGSDNTESGTVVAEVDPRLNLTVKKVFKCPHCSFWATTASRFHVHIVGHLNKKPFECSLCFYRSNWRWDITKHIRLKSARDPSHLEAQVNMTDETGRRNYSKYNKFLTMMRVQEPTAESSGTGRRTKIGEITQGSANEKDIIPAPPRLTRAPTPGAAHPLPQGVPIRPPPLLKAAGQNSSKLSGNTTGISEGTKKTMWKCKKCQFRHEEREQVLAHVKDHYGKKSEQMEAVSVHRADSPSDSNSEPGSAKAPPFRCGHCHQVSNWKHVIQRHCRLKHSGDVKVQSGWKDQHIEPGQSLDDPGSLDDPANLIFCDICPFTTENEGDLTAHKLNHVDRPGSIFKCTYCPFYVPSKIAVMEHMEVHGIENEEELASLKVDNFDPSEETFDDPKNDITGEAKRFKCQQCPYLSNSKSQFLYHKQFHRPRNAPFKCLYCSYNVTRRHLLHQHLRVHRTYKQAALGVRDNADDDLKQAAPPQPVSDDMTSGMPEIPLVWVFKAGNFMKMFKCRWCPHVNLRKLNIQEHEKMHNAKDHDTKHKCPHCNYTCTNAGALSCHTKVHQGYHGEIRSLFDPTRSDYDQLASLRESKSITEPEVIIRSEPGSENEDNDLTKYMEEEPLTSQPESSYLGNSFRMHSSSRDLDDDDDPRSKLLHFCNKCPARFFFRKELRIHSKFHSIRLPFRCTFCTYTARQKPHLLAHFKVHTQEYQERTANLVDSYMVSPDQPQPKTAMITMDSDLIEGPVWTVVSHENFISKPKEIKSDVKPPTKQVSKLPCPRCPATFFKSVALQYHLTLHGGSHQHKCKYCDYTVKTYGNLIKHQLVHETNDPSKPAKPKVQKHNTIPLSGTDLYQQKSEAQQYSDEFNTRIKVRSVTPNRRRTDPQFGTLMLGSPEFIYPTYLKNGKVKEKRYKCHKCPSAFEKRDQYKIHLSLHGSKQKYICEKCDYSVKYYANYVQHMRKHQSNEEAQEARKAENKGLPGEVIIKNEMGILNETGDSATNSRFPQPCKEIFIPGTQQVITLTHIEQQTLLLMERKKHENANKDEERRYFWCYYCPYSSNRRDAVENHTRRHYCVSRIKSGFECNHCDYTTAQSNFLREHNKLHFTVSTRHKAEAFLKCDRMELWSAEEKSNLDEREALKELIFQDKGEDNERDRFNPTVADIPNEQEEEKIYVNPITGERETQVNVSESSQNFEFFDVESVETEDAKFYDSHVSSNSEPKNEEDLLEMIEESVEEIPYIVQPKPKFKRWRGKNLKCDKCPHAFGKKDQYLRHIALHGSNQKHRCDICDYSVKFYTNYVQHMRMHQANEPDRVIEVKKNIPDEPVVKESGYAIRERNFDLIPTEHLRKKKASNEIIKEEYMDEDIQNAVDLINCKTEIDPDFMITECDVEVGISSDGSDIVLTVADNQLREIPNIIEESNAKVTSLNSNENSQLLKCESTDETQIY